MKIDDDLLMKLENLSSLKIEESKRKETIEQLSKIVNFVENLDELDLENEDASFNMIDGGTFLRQDLQKTDTTSIGIILENAPKKEGKFFCVPPIIE